MHNDLKDSPIPEQEDEQRGEHEREEPGKLHGGGRHGTVFGREQLDAHQQQHGGKTLEINTSSSKVLHFMTYVVEFF